MEVWRDRTGAYLCHLTRIWGLEAGVRWEQLQRSPALLGPHSVCLLWHHPPPPRPSSPASQPRGSLSAASRTLVISLPCLLLAGISFLGCLAQILNNRICCGLSPSLLSALRSLGRCQPVVLVIRDFVEEGVVADGALWFSWQRFAAISTHKSVSLAGRRGQQTGWHVWYNA